MGRGVDLRAAVKQLIDEGKAAERQGKRSLAASRYAQAAIRLRRRGRLAPARSLLERAVRLSPASPKLYVQLMLVCADERKLDEAGRVLETLVLRVRARPDRRKEYDAYVERELAPLPSLLASYHAALGDAPNAARAVAEASASPEPFAPSYPDGEARNEPVPDEPVPERSLAIVADPDALTLSALIRKLEVELDLEPVAFAKTELPAGFVERLHDALKNARDAIDLGIAFVVMEVPEVAAAFFDRVAEDDAAYGEAQCLAAGAFLAAGDWLAALDRAQRALRLPPKSPDVLAESTYQLAWAYARLGDGVQARARLALLEKTFPNYRDMQGLRAVIAELADEPPGRTGEGSR